MPMEQLPGSHLLVALHSQMERTKTVVRVSQAASKKPHSRSNVDINCIHAETQNVALFTKDGPAVHRDLCHVLQAVSVSQMQSFRLPGEYKSGVMACVMQGRLQVRTCSRAAFEHGLNCVSSNSDSISSCNSPTSSSSGCSDNTGNNSCCGSPASIQNSSGKNLHASPNSSPASRKDSAGNSPGSSGGNTDGYDEVTKNQGKAGSASAPSEADLKALFNSIDKDGSGAIDVEELQYALSVMGIEKSPAEVQELMASVDKDGSGELEFEEFVLILTTKLGLGGASTESAWQELPDGTWCLEVQQGGCFGEAALLQGLAQEGMVLALEDSSLLILEANAYHPILTHGFDGQLNEKVAILKRCSALASCISNRSDLRGLAYAAVGKHYGWGGQLYSAGQPAGAVYIIQEGCCRVVARQRVESSSTASTATAQSSSLAAAADVSAVAAAVVCQQPDAYPAHHCSEPEPAAVAVGRPAAAAAALLSSPRHGLHSPRSRMVERRTELAVLGPGDIAGEASLLGMASHQSSAVVSSASLVVLMIHKQELKQLLHPTDMQQLMELLQMREDERQQRLLAASATSTAVQRQQQHVKAAAGTAAGASELPPAWNTPEDAATRNIAVSDKAPGRRAVYGNDGECAADECSGIGDSYSRASACKSPRVDEIPQGLVQLPSTAASVAAAIAAAGGSSTRDLPSRLRSQRVNFVYQLLGSMSTSTRAMQEAQSAAVSCAAAALAAAQAEAAAAAAAGSGRGSLSSRIGTASGYGIAALYTSGSTAGGRFGVTAAQNGVASHSGSKPATTAADSGGSSSRQLASGSASSPSTATQNGSSHQHITAAELLLPPGLQRKLEAALVNAGGDSMAACVGSKSTRPYRHHRIHKRSATAMQGIGLIVGTAGNEVSSSSRPPAGCRCGLASCSGACTIQPFAHGGGSHSHKQTCDVTEAGGQLEQCHIRCNNGHEKAIKSNQHALKSTSASCTACSASATGTPTTFGHVLGSGQVQQLQQQQQSDSSTHTTNGSGAVMQQLEQSCCSICGSRAGSKSVSSTFCSAASPRGCRLPGSNSLRGSGCSSAAAAAAAAAAAMANLTSSPRTTQRLSAVSHLRHPASPRSSSAALLQPLGLCTAPSAAIGNSVVQGSMPPVVTSRSSEGSYAICFLGGNGDHSSLAMCTGATRDAAHDAVEPHGCQHGQIWLQGSVHAPCTEGLFLTDGMQDCWNAPATSVSEEAAAAISAAVAAARTMRATNSIDLCLSRTHTPRTHCIPRASRVSLPAADIQQAPDSNAAVSTVTTATDSAASTRARSSTAAAMLRSATGSMYSADAGRHQSSSVLQATQSPRGPTTVSGSCTVFGADSTSCTSNTTCSLFPAAPAASYEMQPHTPRSSRTSCIGAKPVPVRLFSAIDRPVWQAAEAATGCTSWSLGVRLLQSPGVNADRRGDCPASRTKGCPGTDADTPSARAGSLPANQQQPAAWLSDLQPQQQLTPVQLSHTSRHSHAQCVPQLPLHKLQGMPADTGASFVAAHPSAHNRSTDGAAVLQISTSSTVESHGQAADDVVCSSSPASRTLTAAAGDKVKTMGRASDKPAGSQAAPLVLGTPRAGKAGDSGQQVMMPGSLQQRQHQKQQHDPAHRPGSVPLQQVQLPFDSAAATGGLSMPVAPLPLWRSASTTKWRPGGRFSQSGGAQAVAVHVDGSQTSRF